MDCWDQHDKGNVMVTPPPLKNDCFALPPGVDWTPVDDALAQLKSTLRCVVSTETVDISRLRTKLKEDPKNPQLIKTIYGAGYIFLGDVSWDR